jgi:hypothetical protein
LCFFASFFFCAAELIGVGLDAAALGVCCPAWPGEEVAVRTEEQLVSVSVTVPSATGIELPLHSMQLPAFTSAQRYSVPPLKSALSARAAPTNAATKINETAKVPGTG